MEGIKRRAVVLVIIRADNDSARHLSSCAYPFKATASHSGPIDGSPEPMLPLYRA